MVLLPHVQVLLPRASERQLLTQAQTVARYSCEYLIIFHYFGPIVFHLLSLRSRYPQMANLFQARQNNLWFMLTPKNTCLVLFHPRMTVCWEIYPRQ